MNTCKTCKHWDKWHQEDIDFMPSDILLGSCNLLGNESSKLGNDIRVYSDSLPITTEENFGCIHHKEK